MKPSENSVGSRTGAERAPGSRLARRRSSDSRLQAVAGRRRDESAPPTQPSIAPPSALATNEIELIRSDEAPLRRWQSGGWSLKYSLALVAGGVLFGAAGLLVAANADARSLPALMWGFALCLLLMSSSVAVLAGVWFWKRLTGLAAAVRRLAKSSREADAADVRGDVIDVLAHCIGKMSDRIDDLTRELERETEQERTRVDALVRERTRQLAEEADDLRRLLGPAKAVLSVDAQGRLLGRAASTLLAGLGSVPEGVRLWEYLERGDRNLASRFEAAWRDMLRSVPDEIDLRRMPKSLALGDRYLALEYQAVQAADGGLERLLVVLTDITVPDADVVTPV